jgi:hypothetical protein
VTTVHYRYATVQGWRRFYREAGPRDAPATEEFWKPLREYWQDQNPQTEAPLRQALTLEAIRWQYLHGVPERAVAFADDAPAAETHLLDGGHFLLESHLDAAAGSIRRFLDRTLP